MILENGFIQSLQNDNTVKIPDEAEQKRLREILDTLRERAGEYDRPKEELEYIRKLLEKF